MSRRNVSEAGFSVVELLITLTLAVLIGIFFFTLFKANLVQYLNIQKDGTTSTTLASQQTRLANVLRGITGFVSAANNDLVAYAYFYPSDSYVSQIHYYLSGTQLIATVTPMSANPPNGTPQTGSMRTYVIIPNFYQVGGTPLFVYGDSSGTALSTPVTDINAIKTIQVNLAATTATGGNQIMTLQVSLRNGKTNL